MTRSAPEEPRRRGQDRPPTVDIVPCVVELGRVEREGLHEHDAEPDVRGEREPVRATQARRGEDDRADDGGDALAAMWPHSKETATRANEPRASRAPPPRSRAPRRSPARAAASASRTSREEREQALFGTGHVAGRRRASPHAAARDRRRGERQHAATWSALSVKRRSSRPSVTSAWTVARAAYAIAVARSRASPSFRRDDREHDGLRRPDDGERPADEEVRRPDGRERERGDAHREREILELPPLERPEHRRPDRSGDEQRDPAIGAARRSS